MTESKSARIARLHTGWALKHLLQARQFQDSCTGNGPAMELSVALDDAIEKLAEKDPDWGAALRIERELRDADLI